ncbi:tail collar fiber protein [Pectobacterium bacteriophage PM2]|uniref:Short tail fiber protein n=1 Tax=Pectobacterium bacteriophage PM2 TaxID=1429794 RepID=A0A0A0Q0S7_9CAUD|nr:tail collar fiber protein [Pectobacterium bacteriophage PM2]AHY25143.1 short tail fiber protein [Pectobacterium bacteriophage PM2]
MSTNTIRHVSDESSYKIFNPAGTGFPPTITNVQDALASINPQAVNGIPNATQATIGISRFGTQAEIDAGVLTTVGVSPATLKSAVTRPPATTTVSGLTRYATSPESIAGTIDNAAIVPSGLKAALDNRTAIILNTQATELTMGVGKISTQVAALAGVDDLTIMTPKKVAIAIAAATATLPVYSNATTTNSGLVRIATSGEVQAGTLDTGVAVSPAGLRNFISTTARRGIIQLATLQEVSDGVNNDKAITPATLLGRTGSTIRLGVVKLTTTAGVGDSSTALAYNADVIHQRGGQTITGNLNIIGSLEIDRLIVHGSGEFTESLNVRGNLTQNSKQVVTIDMLGSAVPIGFIGMWGTNAPLEPGWRDLDGWAGYLGDPNYAKLQSLYPTGLPDARGLFMRGAGVGKHITDETGTDAKGKNKLGNGCGGGVVGTVQPQMLRKHKHIVPWGEHWGGPFGNSAYGGREGSHSTDHDNVWYFSNDGEEIEPAIHRGPGNTLNTEGLMGDENRPWNMSIRYIIKVQ